MNIIHPASKDDLRTSNEWWRGAVIYQIYPRSFFDSNNDGVGDLKGITSKLDYIADLNVDGIWISPFFTSPMKDFGYDVADYCDVDPIFGTLQDFDELITQAHKRNLKVIIDQVYSHTSDEHDWFAQSRKDASNSKSDWYVWADSKPDGTPPCNWQSVFGGPAWTWDARRKQYYMHNFLKEQPQLNVHNPDVQNALLDAAHFWLKRGVDGFRLDAINFSMHNQELTDNPASNAKDADITRPFDKQLHVHNQSQPEIPAFLERIRALMNEYGATFSVAEVGGPDPIHEMRSFTANNTRLNSAYNFDFLYAEKITPTNISTSLSHWQNTGDEGWPSWAFSNHDAPRAVSRWLNTEDFPTSSSTLILLLLSLRGNPIIYQGEELGLPQAEIPFDKLTDPEAIANWPLTLGRDGSRSPMPWQDEAPYAGFSTEETWLPVDPRHLDLSVGSQLKNANSCLNATRELLAIRKNHIALQIGTLEITFASEEILAFKRTHAEETVYCFFNLSSNPVTLAQSDEFILLACETGSTNDSLELPETLPPWSGFWATPKEMKQ